MQQDGFYGRRDISPRACHRPLFYRDTPDTRVSRPTATLPTLASRVQDEPHRHCYAVLRFVRSLRGSSRQSTKFHRYYDDGQR